MKPKRWSQKIITIALITLLSLISALPAFAHNGGGGSDGGGNSGNSGNVAPSGFISAPFGMPGAPQLIEQQDFGQAGTNSQRAEAQASADALVKFVAINGGSLALGYLTLGSSLGVQMFAAGTYTAVTSAASGDSAEDSATNSAQDVVISVVPAPPWAQGILSNLTTEIRSHLPETAPPSSRGTGTGLYSPPANK